MSSDITVLTGKTVKPVANTILTERKRIFPTKHPFVKNKDGSVSNVKISTVGFGKKTFAIPTMVDGKQLNPDQAVEIARKFGLDKYPSFDSLEDAEKWVAKHHGNIDEDGRLHIKGKK